MKTQISRLSSLLLAFVIASCQPAKENSETKIVDHVHDDLELTKEGPLGLKPLEIEYSTVPKNDPDVMRNSGVKTDIRGRLYLPKGDGPFPVIVFLHGNHGTCGTPPAKAGDPRIDDSIQYTDLGSCEPGKVESPSYLGYAYSAQHLASWGYAVVSVNANLGITGANGQDSFDSGLVYARGALVLKHLMKLRSWSQGTLATGDKAGDLSVLKNKLDFTEVGVMGHSRGGEGVRYAYNIYQNAAANSVWKKGLPDLKIKGVFEIAPVDFGTTTNAVKVEARGTAWAVLLGGCDRDVSTFMGTGPFARMLQTNDGFPKAVFAVWGANHNFFNTEWQVSDAPHSCYGNQTPLWDMPSEDHPSIPNEGNALYGVTGSLKQQAFAKALMYSFFRANVGKQTVPSLMDTFDPQYALPKSIDSKAPTSREFVRLQDSQLVASPGLSATKHTEGAITVEPLANKIESDLVDLQKFWDAYASDNGLNKVVVNYQPDSFIRKSLILESDTLSQEQLITLPFQSTTSTNDFWTVDATFARRTGCYSYPETECLPDSSISDVDVAVVYEDGNSSNFVHLTDYIKLENFHNNYFEMVGAQPFPTDSKSYNAYFDYVPLLYSTARFELTDFSAANQRIKGLRLKFPAGKPVALAVDDIRLVKRPSIAH